MQFFWSLHLKNPEVNATVFTKILVLGIIYSYKSNIDIFNIDNNDSWAALISKQ